MDASRFDAWTRRRFGLAAGGTAALLGLSVLGDAEAKKKHKHKKKKKCRKSLQTCGGKKKKCCKSLTCGDTLTAESVCCKPIQGTCNDASECCGDFICDDITGLTGTRCCGAEGRACSVAQDCCEGFDCFVGTCTSLVPSDRALKANFGSVDPSDMLRRVQSLPISTWNYTSDDAAIRHIGPMAQDFSAAFGVGADDRHIHPIDGQGVALAAIQGLAAQLKALEEENARLAARIAALEG